MALGALRKFKPLDWSKVKANLAPQDFAIVSEQRSRHAEATRILATPLPKIDLSHYKRVLKNLSLLEQAEAALASFSPVSVNTASILKDLENQEVAAVLTHQ